MSGLTEHINRALNEAMRVRRLKRQELAARLALSPRTVRRILKNRRHNWEIATLERWCRAIGCGLEVLITDPLDRTKMTVTLKGPIFAILRGFHG